MPQNTRNDDLYWNHWLKANSLNVTQTSQRFLQNLKWREEQNIDTIHLEDWSYFLSDYPAFQDSFDKSGKPIIEIWLSDWNIRQAVISGRSIQVIRWIIYNMEMGMRRIFQKRADGYTNVTGAMEILDFSGVSARTHGCLNCGSMYGAFQNIALIHYPGILEEVYLLNLAQGYKTVISLWRQSLSPELKQIFKVYGRETEWISILQSKVDKDQFTFRRN